MAALRNEIEDLRSTNDLVGREAIRHEGENRSLRAAAGDRATLLHKRMTEQEAVLRGTLKWLENLLGDGKDRPWQWVVIQLQALLRYEATVVQRQNLEALDAGQLQVVILALAELALRRPGWQDAVLIIAEHLGGEPAQTLLSRFQGVSKVAIKSFISLRDELWDWSNGTGGMGPAYPSTTETGKVVREIAERLDRAITQMEEDHSARL